MIKTKRRQFVTPSLLPTFSVPLSPRNVTTIATSVTDTYFNNIERAYFKLQSNKAIIVNYVDGAICMIIL